MSREDDKDSSEGSRVVRPAILASAVVTICSVQKVDPKDAEKIAMATLRPSHHPYIVYAKTDVWLNILHILNIDPANFVTRHAQECLALVCTDDCLDNTEENIATTLCRVSPGVMGPQMVAYVAKLLSEPALAQVTQEEYGIFLTPEGELYDRSILDSAMKSASQGGNIRRENKAYSYKEQLAEIELRKEIEKKKGKKAADPPPKLSKKQEEQLAQQKQKEADIRGRLVKLNKTVLCGCTIVESMLRASSDEIASYIKDLYSCVISLLTSPLAASHCSNLWVSLGQAAFTDKQLGELLSPLLHRHCLAMIVIG